MIKYFINFILILNKLKYVKTALNSDKIDFEEFFRGNDAGIFSKRIRNIDDHINGGRWLYFGQPRLVQRKSTKMIAKLVTQIALPPYMLYTIMHDFSKTSCFRYCRI
ncbi:hypothetical protein Q757_02440 [Oenococcus alcoholitolerans]|uniref:Uncharacterized protein n=1 Tax=Oenococcus alcoholitolerans TaxID=931074 RepID=A0ABR4XS11_9LACO|nr:hypothetical protein Q757_02440 [Oenococcus alcoholitolerans]